MLAIQIIIIIQLTNQVSQNLINLIQIRTVMKQSLKIEFQEILDRYKQHIRLSKQRFNEIHSKNKNNSKRVEDKIMKSIGNFRDELNQSSNVNKGQLQHWKKIRNITITQSQDHKIKYRNANILKILQIFIFDIILSQNKSEFQKLRNQCSNIFNVWFQDIKLIESSIQNQLSAEQFVSLFQEYLLKLATKQYNTINIFEKYDICQMVSEIYLRSIIFLYLKNHKNDFPDYQKHCNSIENLNVEINEILAFKAICEYFKGSYKTIGVENNETQYNIKIYQKSIVIQRSVDQFVIDVASIFN